MIVSLCFCILVLLAIVVRLLMKFRRQQKVFQSKIKSMQDTIVEISRKHIEYQERLQLADELDQSLKSIKANLSTSIFDLNFELMETLSKNNLLK
ncbi:MAG: hypothetical protein IPN80_07025 [Flavobacterium sp.]|nr:hypothetical protein [Flavobacterium sp.]